MYNNYNLETSRIFKDAEKIMISLNHGYVGTEHLFLSMLKNSEEIRNLLEKYQIEYDDFLEELLLVVNSETCKKVACIYTPLLKKVIKNAEMHAKNSYITPLMLLESLLEEGEGIAIRILISMGLDIDKLYDEIKQKDKTQPAVFKQRAVNIREYAGAYMDSWKVRLTTSNCCSRLRRLKFTA